MNRIIRSTLVLGLAALLSACGQPTLDGSSSEALHASTQKVAKSLDKKEAKELKDNIAFIMSTMISSTKFEAQSIKSKTQEAFAKLDGKTAEEVAVLANELRESEKSRKAQSAVVDGSSKPAFEKSLQEMAQTLDKDDQDKLMEMIKVIGKDVRDNFGEGQHDSAMKAVMQKLDGKNFKQITEMAQSINTNQG